MTQASSLVAAMARLLLQEDALNALSQGPQLTTNCPLRMMMSTCLFKKMEDGSNKPMAASPEGEA